jgi:hypothetical protein
MPDSPPIISRPRLGFALGASLGHAAALAPLLAEGLVEAFEWSVDIPVGAHHFPWFEALLDAASAGNRLYGHAVLGSPHSLVQIPQAERDRAKLAPKRHSLRMITDHYGHWSVPGLRAGAPLPPLPGDRAAHAAAADYLRELHQETGILVGLEDLAFVWGAEDARARGDTLERLLAPIDGVLLLDLHNLFCQAVNTQIPAERLLERLPLHRVRVAHLSGGSWQTLGGRTLRRDTHDGAVPQEVWDLLREAIPRCPNLEAVFVESIAFALHDPTGQGPPDPQFGNVNLAAVDTFLADIRRLNQVLGDQQRPTPLRAASKVSGLLDSLAPNMAIHDDFQSRAWQSALAQALRTPEATHFPGADPAQINLASRIFQHWSRPQ